MNPPVKSVQNECRDKMLAF